MAAVTQVDLLARLIDASAPTFAPEAAQAILQISYTQQDHARMAELAAKSNEGSLSTDDREELEVFVLIGDFLSLLKSKARVSLMKHSPAA